MSKIYYKDKASQYQEIDLTGGLLPEVHFVGFPNTLVHCYDEDGMKFTGIDLDDQGRYSSLILENYGTYTFTNEEFSIELKVDTVQVYTVDFVALTQEPRKTWTVVIDTTNSDPEKCCTYADDAVGHGSGWDNWKDEIYFKDIKPCVLKDGDVQYYLNPDNYDEREDGSPSNIEGEDGDVMVEFPKLGYYIRYEGNNLLVSITNEEDKPNYCYLAHTYNNEGDCDKLYIGAYCVDEDIMFNLDDLRSIANKKIATNFELPWSQTINQYTGVFSYPSFVMLQCLYLIVFKNLDSKKMLGTGENLNLTGTMTKTMGLMSHPGATRVKMFGIEDMWRADYSQVLAGSSLDIDNKKIVFTPFTQDIWSNNVNSHAKYEELIDVNLSSYLNSRGDKAYYLGYINKVTGTNYSGFLPSAYQEGSETSYWCSFLAVNKDEVLQPILQRKTLFSFGAQDVVDGEMIIGSDGYFRIEHKHLKEE